MQVYKPADTMLLLGYQSRGGQPSLTVTVGYCCGRDGTRLSEQETWAWLAPLFAEEPFDLSQKKYRGGFGVAGDACAPGGQPIAGLTVRAGVGALSTTALVQGDRYWTRGLTGWQASAPQPFTRMPVGLARAYGGKGWARNPYGRGHCPDPAQADGIALPNVERPHEPVLRPADAPAPAVLGVLPQGSSEQTRWLGSVDARWQRLRMPWLPDDTDPRWSDRFEQDQCQPAYWHGDEAWFAQNMHPRHSDMRGTLPGLRPRLLIRGDAAPEQRAELPLDLDTVWLFPNQERVLVLYRGQAAVRREDAEDVLGLAVFTESMSESAQTTGHWAAIWKQHDDQRLQLAAVPAAPVAATDAAAKSAAAAEATAQTAQAAAAHRESVGKILADTRASAVADADKAARGFGFGPLGPKLARAASRPPAPGAGAVPPVPVAWPRNPAAFTAAVHRHVEDTLAAAQAQVRAEWKKYGIDYDAAVARAKAKRAGPLDAGEIISKLNIDPQKKQALQQQFAAFQSKLGAVESQAADIAKRAARLREQVAAGEPVPETSAATEVSEEVLPRGPRASLDRETLLARHALGEAAPWSSLKGLDLSGLDLSGVKLNASVIEQCSLRGANLEGADFSDCELLDCDLQDASLGKARFVRARLAECAGMGAAMAGADFSHARLTKSGFPHADMAGTVWTHAQAKECDFEKAGMRGAQAHESRFKSCRFGGVDASASRFSKAMLDTCSMQGATWDGAALDGATLLACEATAARFEAARLTGLRTLKGTSLRQANLSRANMDRAVLQDTDLGRANLREVYMDRGFVKNCDLSGTDAWRLVARACDFTGSRIVQASWRGANLMKAKLRQVLLQDVDLTGSNLHAADTRTATAQGIRLEQALLTRCRLLEGYGREAGGPRP